MAIKTRQYIFKQRIHLTDFLLHLHFVTADKLPFTFIPGQFITFHILESRIGSMPITNEDVMLSKQQVGCEQQAAIDKISKIKHRSYTIANIPSGNQLEILCSCVPGGMASELFLHLKPDAILEASGPHGLFVLKETDHYKRLILVSTGTGTAPYRAMIHQLKDRLCKNPALEIIVIEGARTAQELLFVDDFLALSNQYGNFKFYACYSREKKNNALMNFHEIHGYVQDVLKTLTLNPQDDLIYLCGNPKMIDDNFLLLTTMGFERTRIRREKYAFSH